MFPAWFKGSAFWVSGLSFQQDVYVMNVIPAANLTPPTDSVAAKSLHVKDSRILMVDPLVYLLVLCREYYISIAATRPQ